MPDKITIEISYPTGTKLIWIVPDDKEELIVAAIERHIGEPYSAQ